jgi:hypothetical protein
MSTVRVTLFSRFIDSQMGFCDLNHRLAISEASFGRKSRTGSTATLDSTAATNPHSWPTDVSKAAKRWFKSQLHSDRLRKSVPSLWEQKLSLLCAPGKWSKKKDGMNVEF